jgi:hypothetical protein
MAQPPCGHRARNYNWELQFPPGMRIAIALEANADLTAQPKTRTLVSTSTDPIT